MKLASKIIIVALLFILMGCMPSSPTVLPPSVTPKPTRFVFLPTITPLPPTRTLPATLIKLPPEDYLYQGVYPGGRSGEEDDITLDDLLSYEQTVGKNAVWMYFSNNWYRSRKFPVETASWVRAAGSIPYIRLMLRSGLKHNGGDTDYSLQNILDGKFDDDLHAWCAAARDFGTPLLVEYGTEVNSDSFAWSGVSNGGGETTGYGDPTLADGPEHFRDAYRHIIQICRDEEARNITWVFHLDSEDHPDADWNRPANYYPGDEWIDWIGVSIYGAYTPKSGYVNVFSTSMDDAYQNIVAFAPKKPVIVSEFGTAKNNLFLDQADWARDALTVLTSGRYSNLIGFSWWNEWWQNNGNSSDDTTMRVQDNPELAKIFKDMVGDNPNVLGQMLP